MIHPKRLSGKAANVARYYNRGDYYTKGRDEPSEWGGKLAEELGLSGRVDADNFEDLLAGKVGEQQLGRHGQDGSIEHHPGWDFAVNAPKSVSIAALVMDDRRVLDAHERAVGTALDYLEEHAMTRRREAGEIVHETTGRLLWARFTEHASRELDPHLHTHAVVLNMTNREDGESMRSVDSRAMFAAQMTAGQIYRNELAHALREQGWELEIDHKRGMFEIAGIPQLLIKEFSKRAEQIEQHAQEKGHEGQAQRVISWYETRGRKETIGLDALHGRWDEATVPHREALDNARAAAAERGERTIDADGPTVRRAALFGIRQAEEKEAVNDRGKLLRGALSSHVGEVRLRDVDPHLGTQEDRGKLLATHEQTGDRVLTRGRTSERTVRLELEIARQLTLAQGDAPALAPASRVLQVLETAGLNPKQEAALAHVATSRDRILGIQGVAGAGKSQLAEAMVRVGPEDHVYFTLAPTSSAAAELGRRAQRAVEQSGRGRVEEMTTARLLATGGRGLDRNATMIVDEASQAGNRTAPRLMELSRQTGARLLFMGDHEQTGSIEQGKPFWLMQQLGLPTNQLPESVRQATRAMKAAVTQARAGDYSAAIGNLDHVTTGQPKEGLAEALVRDWTRLSPENRAQTNILVLDNATRVIINERVRTELKREGVVAAEDARLEILLPARLDGEEKRLARFYSSGQVVMFGRDNIGAGVARDVAYRVVRTSRDARGRAQVEIVDEQGRTLRFDPRTINRAQVNVFESRERGLAAGDRIQWRVRNAELDVKNAERGTVLKVEGTTATIRWDRGERIQSIDLARHKTWDHGYAETVYSAQSKTYDRVFIIAPQASPLVTGQTFYTALSRARYGARLWTEDTRKLVERLERNPGAKTSALEGLDRIKGEHVDRRAARDGKSIAAERDANDRDRRDAEVARQRDRPDRLGPTRAERAGHALASSLHALVDRALGRATAARARAAGQEPTRPIPAPAQLPSQTQPERGGRGIDR